MMQKRILRVLGFLRVRGVLGIWVALAAQASVAGAAETSNYPRAAEPIIKPVLVALPPGAGEPAGWLRDWALAARDGITGHLDERHATFRDGWKGVRINSTGAYGADAVTDPTGPATGLLPRAPRRGWDLDAKCCHSAHRSGSAPGDRFDDVSSRVARVIVDK